MVAWHREDARFDLPAFIRIGNGRSEFPGRNPEAGCLGVQYNPLYVRQPGTLPRHVAPAVVPEVLRRRLALARLLNDEYARAGATDVVRDQQQAYDRAARLALSPRLGAFDLSREPDHLRDDYGRTEFGQGCLLARRLVERGVSFVEVLSADGPEGWDTHRGAGFKNQAKLSRTVDAGYRVFHWSHHPWDDWPEGHAYIDWLERQGHDYRALHEKHGYIPTELNQTTWCATMAIDFLEEKRDAPWLFSLNCFDPHPDFDPPEEFLGRFDVDALPGPLYRDSDLAAQRRLAAIKFQSEPVPQRGRAAKLRVAQYWAEVELIDRNVGRLLKALEESGQLDNTLIISWPAKLKQGLVSDALVEMVDLAPTLLELTGLELDASGAPGKMHGRSLVPILTGAADPSRHRDLVHCEYHRAIRGMPSYGTMVRTRRHKLVVYHGAGLGGDGLGELFDLEKDPGEFENRWDDPAYAELKLELLLKSFDATVRATDIGPRRVGSY